jgi:ferric-dicitrate binding protein FerR (iron transport regulator)
MIKKISVLLAFVALLFAELALAQGAAVVTSVVGTANVQTGPGAPHALRLGDQVQQGDTVSTGAGSSLVLKFDDGEVTALTQNSRMTITAYQYEPTSSNGNILLSLVTGGMRAITGLLGGNHPERVAYRAATATIGIRGTDVTIASDGTNVIVTVNTGAIVLTLNGHDYPLSAGQTGYIQGNTFHPGPPPPGTLVSSLGFAVTELQGMTDAINSALASATSSGQGTGNTPGTNVPPGGAGGGSASVR